MASRYLWPMNVTPPVRGPQEVYYWVKLFESDIGLTDLENQVNVYLVALADNGEVYVSLVDTEFQYGLTPAPQAAAYFMKVTLMGISGAAFVVP